MSQRSFIKSVKKQADVEEEPIVFDLTTFDEDPEGELLENGRGGPLVDEDGVQIRGTIRRQDIFTSHRPTDDQLLVSMVQAGRADATTADRVAVVFDFFKNSLSPAEYRVLMARVKDAKDEVDTEMLTEIFEWLQEEWSETDFPTEPSSASSPPRKPSGTSSTGRSRSKASTPSR